MGILMVYKPTYNWGAHPVANSAFSTEKPRCKILQVQCSRAIWHASLFNSARLREDMPFFLREMQRFLGIFLATEIVILWETWLIFSCKNCHFNIF